MSHDLMMRDGEARQAAMFYVGERPWHGLGVRLDGPPTAAEAITAAGLNWRVVKAPLYVVSGHRVHTVANRYALVRADRLGADQCPAFAIVTGQYEPLQNRDAFRFFDPLVREFRAEYHTAGALGNGERVWVLVRLPDVIRVGRDDVVEKFLLLTTTHDGSGAVQVLFTPIRVVCQNTLSQALERGRGLRVPHTRDLEFGMAGAREVVLRALRHYHDTAQAFERMRAFRLDQVLLQQYLATVFPDPAPGAVPDGDAAAVARRREQTRARRYWAEALFAEGEGNQAPDVRGSLWAAYNGVTELVDHGAARLAGQGAGVEPGGVAGWGGVHPPAPRPGGVRPAPPPPMTSALRKAGMSAAQRQLHAKWFGAGATVKADAYAAALRLVANA